MNRLQTFLANRLLGIDPDLAGGVAAVESLQRGNDPLAAMQATGSSGLGLTTDQINKWLATFTQPARRSNGSYYQTSVPVYKAVRIRSSAIARARMKVYRIRPDGEREWLGENNKTQMFLDKVNPDWTHNRMWRAVETYLCLWGKAFLWIEKPTNDVASWNIWLLRPDRVAVVKGRDGTIAGYIHDPHGSRFPMMPEEIIYFRYFNPLDEFDGQSPLMAGIKSIEMQQDMLDYNRNFFKRGLLVANLAFFLNGPLDDEKIEEFHNRMEQRYSGTGNAGRSIVFDRGQGDVKNLGLSNKEMEFLDGIQLAKEHVADIYDVPEEMMAGARNPTFSNRATAINDFYINVMTQEWEMLEAEMQEHLIPMLPTADQNVLLAFDLDDIEQLQESINEKTERELKEIEKGTKTINEVRQERNKPPLPWGDSWWIPFNKLPAGETTETPAAPAKPAQTLIVPDHALYAPAHARALQGRQDKMDERAWGSYCRRLDAGVPLVEKLQQDLFKQQRAAVLKAVKENARTLVPTMVSRGALGSNGQHERLVELIDIFNPDDWRATYMAKGEPGFTAVLVESGNAQSEEFGLGVTVELGFDMGPAALRRSPELTKAWIQERLAFWADRVNAETARLLISELQEANLLGEGIPAIEQRVGMVFDISDTIRKERIARTEVTAYSNQGHLEAYEKAGVELKRWLAALDSRTRGAHVTAHGQVVALKDPFTVGGEALMAPGQGGSAGNVINCRCTTTPVVK